MGPALALAEEIIQGDYGFSLLTQNVASFLAVDTAYACAFSVQFSDFALCSDGGIRLQGVGSRADVIVPNIRACKVSPSSIYSPEWCIRCLELDPCGERGLVAVFNQWILGIVNFIRSTRVIETHNRHSLRRLF